MSLSNSPALETEASGSSSTPLKAMALSYAERGWPVIPLHAVLEGKCSCAHVDCPSPGKHLARHMVLRTPLPIRAPLPNGGTNGLTPI